MWIYNEISGRGLNGQRSKWSQTELKAAGWLLAGLNRNVQLLEILDHWYQAALGPVTIPLVKFDPNENLLRDRSAFG